MSRVCFVSVCFLSASGASASTAPPLYGGAPEYKHGSIGWKHLVTDSQHVPCTPSNTQFDDLEVRIQQELARPQVLALYRKYGNTSLWGLEPNSQRNFVEYAFALLQVHIHENFVYSPLSVELETDVLTALARNHDFLEVACPPLAMMKSICQIAVLNRGNILGLHQPVVQEQGARVKEKHDHANMISTHSYLKFMLEPIAEATGVVQYITHRSRMLHLTKEVARALKFQRQLPYPQRDIRNLPHIWQSMHSFGQLPSWSLYPPNPAQSLPYPYPLVSYAFQHSAFNEPRAGWAYTFCYQDDEGLGNRFGEYFFARIVARLARATFAVSNRCEFSHFGSHLPYKVAAPGENEPADYWPAPPARVGSRLLRILTRDDLGYSKTAQSKLTADFNQSPRSPYLLRWFHQAIHWDIKFALREYWRVGNEISQQD